MRTTLTIEADVAARLRTEARRTGRSFKDLVNECLRSGLAQRKSSQRPAHFVVKPRDFGELRPGLSLDNIDELLERVEGPDHP
ncbi:MAG: hypothetical protein ACRER4_06890 [Steroidobacteraceae bacterium]